MKSRRVIREEAYWNKRWNLSGVFIRDARLLPCLLSGTVSALRRAHSIVTDRPALPKSFPDRLPEKYKQTNERPIYVIEEYLNFEKK
jgi:hypothetical protein